jgi:hypothetical protein
VSADPIDSVEEKVSAIFRELVGDRAGELDGSVLSIRTRDAIAGRSRPKNLATTLQRSSACICQIGIVTLPFGGAALVS